MKIVEITDIDLLVRLRFDFFDAMGHPVENGKSEIEASLRNYFRNHTGKDFMALAVMEEDDIASVAYLTVNEIPANGSAPNGLAGTLLNVLTYPPYRGRGYAARLIEAIKTEARSRNISFIDLYATEQGLPLYTKSGFMPISYRAMRMKL